MSEKNSPVSRSNRCRTRREPVRDAEGDLNQRDRRKTEHSASGRASMADRARRASILPEHCVQPRRSTRNSRESATASSTIVR